jgi:transposase
MPKKLNAAVAVIGIDIGKNSFHIVGLDQRGAIVLRQKWSRGQEARLANLPPCLIGMDVGAHRLSRRLKALGHDARLMPAGSSAPIRRDRSTAAVTQRRLPRRSTADDEVRRRHQDFAGRQI